MRLLWLADALRAAGLTVHEYEGWRTRGSSSYGPIRGIVCHGTAGSLTSTDAGELRTIAITGSNTATAPIAQLYLSRSGAWWVVASGTCTGVKAGTAGPLKGLSDDAVLQIEAQHGTSEPWTDTQYRAYVRGVAALCAHTEPGYDVPVARVVGHYEHQPREKTDPWFDMNLFRADVAAIKGDDMSWQETLTAGADAGGVSYQAKDWLIGTNMAAWRTLNTVTALAAVVEAMAAKVDLDPAELDAVKAAAQAGAQAGIVAAAHQLATAIAAELPAELGLSPEQAESAAERALRKVLGQLDAAGAGA